MSIPGAASTRQPWSARPAASGSCCCLPIAPNPELVADGLRAAFDLNPRAAKHSFRKQQFASDHGVQGLCISYLQQANVKGGESILENSHYLVKNGAGRCVVINYVASADGVDTSAIHRMLRTSLSLQ